MPTCITVRANIKCGLFRRFLEFNAMSLIYVLQTKAFGSANKNYIVRLLGLKFEEETSKMLHLEHGFVWC